MNQVSARERQHIAEFGCLSTFSIQTTKSIKSKVIVQRLSISQRPSDSDEVVVAVAYPVVVQEAFDRSHGGHCDILVPQLPSRKVHDVLLGNGADDLFDFFGAHAASGRDDLPADVFGHGRGAVQGEQEGGLELCLCPLGFRLGDVVGQSRPFSHREMDEVIDLGLVLRNEVDAPKTTNVLAFSARPVDLAPYPVSL